MKFDSKGIPIISLEEKMEALEYCLKEDRVEDALGHLFDLINYIAPEYKFGPFRDIVQIKD